MFVGGVFVTARNVLLTWRVIARESTSRPLSPAVLRLIFV